MKLKAEPWDVFPVSQLGTVNVMLAEMYLEVGKAADMTLNRTMMLIQ